MSDNKDFEPGWGGMAILLWPITLYFKIMQWLTNRRKPKASTTYELHCHTYAWCPHPTECRALQRCTAEDETMG